MIDTGSGVSILSLKAYQMIASAHALSLLPYDIQLYAANGKTINTIGIAENVSFQLGGHTLRTNFIVIADHLGAEDFLLGRNFLRTYNVLVDLTAMRVTIRDPKAPRHFKPVHEVSDHEPSLVISTEKVVLGPYERKLVRAQVISQKHNEYLFRNVMIRPLGVHKRCPFVSEDTLTSVGDEGIVFIAVRNTATFENVTIPTKTVLGKAEPTNFVLQPVAADTATEIDKPLFEQVNRVYTDEWLNETSSEYSSFAQNFLSSTEMSEEGLSESEKRARTDPQLLRPIPGPDLSSVLSSWGEGARDQLASVLSEYDDLFMKHKADIGRCKIAKHRIELEPEAIPHREGARRMSPDKAAKANQEVRNLLALGLIQPSYSPWASGIVMVKKKTGELRFCCDFRPLNDVTVKDAFPLPKIDESLSRIGNAKIFTSIDLAWAFWQIPLKKRDRRKTAFACELGLFEWRRMPFGLCNASATFQRSITRALQRIQQRHGSVVMAYIDDIVIATETIEDHIARIKEVFECLREAGFKMRAEKCDFMRTETKYLGRVVSSEGIKPDPEAVIKIQEWMPPRSREELQSFLGFANYYRDFVPFHAAKVQPLQELLKKSQHFHWEVKHQEAFDAVKEALANAIALAAPNEDGRFVLDTDASAVAIAGILHQEQEHNGKTILRPIVFGSKSLTKTQLNYGAPKLEMYAVFYFIEKFHLYLAGREFTLRVDNQALSWLKTYSMDQAMIGRWIARLDQYNFKTIHRPRTQHRNVDGLSKRTNDYVHREKILEKLPEVSEGFNFMTQEDYEALPTVPYFDKHGRLIPNHPELPPEARAQLPLLYILGKRPKMSLQEPPVSDAPWYPQIQWEATPTIDEDHRPSHILSITTGVPPERLDTGEPDPVLEGMPLECQRQAHALRTVGTELHEHFLTRRGLKDLHLAQNRDVHLLALRKLIKGEPLEDTMFPEDVQDFARRYFHQKKDLLFLNPDDILCVNYVPQQRALHVRPCMIVMPQLYQHEILYRAHDKSGHQGVGKVLARVQERHTWPGIKRDIVNHIKHCLTCQQTKHPAGNPCYPLQNINSSNFNFLTWGEENEEEIVHRSPNQCSTQPDTMNRRGRPRGRPPGRGRPRAIPSGRTTTSSRTQTTRSRSGPRTRVSTRAPPRKLDRAMTLPEVPESQQPPENQNSEPRPSSQTSRYQLRANRAPRYKCGTCGSRNCSCVKQLTRDSPDNRLARGAVVPARDLLMARAHYHPQHEILTVQAQREKVEAPPLVHHLIITVEKTFTSVEREVIPPLEETLRAMHATSPSDCPTYRFKEWTPPHRGGLEFTLHAIIPPLPPSMTFGELAEEDSSPEMVRCITAHQLWEKYRIASPPGDIYQPTNGWWLLVTSLDATTLVSPTTLLMCLESLRTVTEPENTLCFHMADIHRGKFLSQHWLQLIAVIFCRQAKIHFLDRQSYTPEKPVTVNEALSIAHDWSSTNMGDRPLRRTVWEDRKAILRHLAPQPNDDQSNTTGKWLIT